MQEAINQITRFIDKNTTNPFFWVIVFGILLVLTYLAISSFGDK